MITDTRKPKWLNKKIDLHACSKMQGLLQDLELHTVCQEARCPNIGECAERREATFLILGNRCTRNCSFCAVEKGIPSAVDFNEPERVAEAVKRLALRHVVITSVTRDDLADGGASVFIRTVEALRESTDLVIELLIPDFMLNRAALRSLVMAKPDIIAHNLETVPRLYPLVHEGAEYRRSLEVLRLIKEFDTLIYTKSGIMLGLGEEEKEVLGVYEDLRSVKCDFLSIGQYLSPGVHHFPVQEYIPQEKFESYKCKALEYGFKYVASGPYVRSSYLAAEYLDKKKRG